MSTFELCMIFAVTFLTLFNIFLILENRSVRSRIEFWRKLSDVNSDALKDMIKFVVRSSSDLGHYRQLSDNVVEFKRD